MSDEVIGEVVICGVTTLRSTFRPSDWVDRLVSVACQMGHENRLNYFPDVQQVIRAEVRCVVISRELAVRVASTFRFLLAFARENDLEIDDGSKATH